MAEILKMRPDWQFSGTVVREANRQHKSASGQIA